MDKSELEAMLSSLQYENDRLHSQIDSYRDDLLIANCDAQEWAVKWQDCHDELAKLKAHIENLCKAWATEWEKEFGNGF